MRTKFIRWVTLALAITTVGGACHKQNIGGGLSPTVAILPSSGLAGTAVTISGRGFNPDTSMDIVTFNGTRAPVQLATDSQLLVTVPNGTTGPVEVSIGNQHANGGMFTFQSLSITAISPIQGLAGTFDTITGTGLTFNASPEGLAPAVLFNGQVARNVLMTSGQLVVVVPSGRSGVGPVVVTLGELKATGPTYTLFGLDSISPLTGGAGTQLTLTGYFGSTPLKDSVTINGIPAPIISDTGMTKLVVTAPSGVTTGNVQVKINGQVASGPVFTVVPPPTFTSLSPLSGPAGTVVTIQGAGFNTVLNQNVVTFNGVAAITTSASATQLVVMVPKGATTGPVSVSVNGQAVSAGTFTVQPLGVFAITPNDGAAPVTVTISGTGFSPTPALDTVNINGVGVTVTSASDTQLVVNITTRTGTGPVTVNAGGLSATGPIFNYGGVVTLAGGTQGLANGVGTAAQFMAPAGLAIDPSGNVYVADQGANNIRKIASNGTVTNFAGDPNGGAGFTNGQGANAQFNGPTDIVIDQHGNLYVADDNNQVIRLITPNGTVSTFATNPNGDAFYGVAIDPLGNIYASDNSLGSSGVVFEFSPSGTQINSINVDYNNPLGCCRTQLDGVAVDGVGDVWIIDGWAYGLLESVLSGGSFQLAEAVSVNLSNRTGADMGICMDNSGNAVVADGGWNEIDVVNSQTFTTTITFGGGGNGNTNAGYQDGPLATALFNTPTGVKVDAHGVIYVADRGNFAIRKIAY